MKVSDLLDVLFRAAAISFGLVFVTASLIVVLGIPLVLGVVLGRAFIALLEVLP